MADELFLRLLTETAKGAKDRPPLDGRWCLLYPAAKEIKADERPVLAAAHEIGGDRRRRRSRVAARFAPMCSICAARHRRPTISLTESATMKTDRGSNRRPIAAVDPRR